MTIRGTGFTPVDLALFIDDQATPVSYVGTGELRFATPPHNNGFVELRVANQGRSAAAEFLYEPPRMDDIAIGSITTIAGIGQYGAEGGSASAAPFEPSDIAVDFDGSVFISERDRSVIRVVSPRGTTAIIAGRGFPPTPSEQAAGFIGDGGPASDARLDQPNQVAFDGSGNMYILDAFNYRIRKVTPDGIISTIAGNGVRGFSGDGGPATLASFDVGPNGDNGVLKVSPDGTIFLGDTDNRRIRKVDAGTGVMTTILGGGTRTEDGVPATQLQTAVLGIALAPNGTTYFSDRTRVRKIETDGTISTLFGGATAGFSSDGVSTGLLSGTGPLALDLQRNRLLLIERSTNRVRAIDLTTRILSTIAGIGPATFGENGRAIAAELDPLDADAVPLALTADDELLIGGYRRLRRLEPTGVLRTIAGGGIGPNGPPPTPRPALGVPLDVRGIAAAANGVIYVTDAFSVGRITPDATYHRIAGGRYGYAFGFAGDGKAASAGETRDINGLAIDRAGNVYLLDAGNRRVRAIRGAAR